MGEREKARLSVIFRANQWDKMIADKTEWANGTGLSLLIGKKTSKGTQVIRIFEILGEI